jgi:ABC-2 type transport system permease protein
MRAIKAILIRNLTGFVRDKMRLILSIIMSFFFLFIFSFVMKSAPMGVMQPINYLLTGIIIMTVFQTALSNSMGIIDDIASGFMKEILVAPISRTQISIGQVFSSMTIAVLQGLIILILGMFLGLHPGFFQAVEMLGMMILIGFCFSALGLWLASLTRNSTTFQIMVTMISMPLTFLSGALIPTTVFPAFLKVIVFFNPLTYTTSIFRFIALKMENLPIEDLIKQGVAFQFGNFVITPLHALLIIIGMSVLFFILCVRQFDKADFSRVAAMKMMRHR